MNDLLLVLQPNLCQNNEKYSVSTKKPAPCGSALCFVHSYCFGLSFADSTLLSCVESGSDRWINSPRTKTGAIRVAGVEYSELFGLQLLLHYQMEGHKLHKTKSAFAL